MLTREGASPDDTRASCAGLSPSGSSRLQPGGRWLARSSRCRRGPCPWTALDPEPDSDADLATIDPRFIDAHRGDPNAKIRVVVSIEGEVAERLQRISAARGETPGEQVAELLREADRSAA